MHRSKVLRHFRLDLRRMSGSAPTTDVMMRDETARR
jgi:hypothetical protein